MIEQDPAPSNHDGAARPHSYLICTTPRSGSWLLAEALRATEIAGRPEEYFWADLRPLYEEDWGLVNCTDDVFMSSVRERATTPNGVFGAKVHWFEFEHLLGMLQQSVEPGDPLENGPRKRKRADADSELIGAYLPGPRYIHLVRHDKAAQAISWHRAIQTRVWWKLASDHRDTPEPEVPFDPDAIFDLEQRLRRDEWQWISYFSRAGIEPEMITYEDLAADLSGAVSRVLALLGLSNRLGDASATVALQRQADERSAAMKEEYLQWRRAMVSRSHRSTPSVSVVIVSHNEGVNLRRTVDDLVASVPDDVELVVVDDHSTDDSAAFLDNQDRVRRVVPPQRAGVAEARNVGAAASAGDVVVFSDADVSLAPGWLPPLLAELAERDVAAVAPTVTALGPALKPGFGFTWREPSLRMSWLGNRPSAPADVPFLCGCFMVFRRSDFDAVGGFDVGMVTWGSEDAEICLNLWRRDRACRVVPESTIGHLFRSTFPYEVPGRSTLHNTMRLASAVHLDPLATSRTIDHMAQQPAFAPAFADLLDSDVWQRRDEVATRCRHDGAWFVDRFRVEVLR